MTTEDTAESVIEPDEYQEIEQEILPEIKKAKEYADLRTDRRDKSWDRYYGKPLGNEVKGRSKFVTREVMDTIESMMPYFIHTFASGDSKIVLNIKGQEPWVGKALMQEITEHLGASTPTTFLLFYTWFKDGLVSDTSFAKLRWNINYNTIEEELPQIAAAQMQQLQANENIKVVSADEPTWISEINSAGHRNVKVKITQKKGSLVAENTPHWEFIADPLSKDINDEFGKGHRTKVSLDYLRRINRSKGGDYFRNLETITEGSDEQTDTESTNSYLEDEKSVEQLGGGSLKPQDPKIRPDFVEWYTKLDVDDDGYLEDIICFFANEKLIRWEINEDKMIPFSALKPIIDCFKFYGISYADFIIEIQNLKTMLFRRILDNFDFQNSGRWLVDPNANVNMRALLDNRPGGVVTGRVDGVKNLFTGAFNPSSLNILEYVDTIKESRTGITRHNPEAISETATKTFKIESAMMQRLELIGRIFAETGLKDFYHKAALLYQKYKTEPFTAIVGGITREVTPDMLQGTILATVNMGVEASVGMQENQRLQLVVGMLTSLNERYPGLMKPEQIHNIASKFLASAGFSQISDFISDIESFNASVEQNQKVQQAMHMRTMQMNEQYERMRLQIEKQEVDVKAGKAAADKEIRSAGVIQKDKASQREFDLGTMQMIKDVKMEE